jgi:hypothetical protein
MSTYRRNHYVPEWFQKRFFPPDVGERKFYYLDLTPDRVTSNGHTYTRDALLRWGPDRCFYRDDLYTTSRWLTGNPTVMEERFFGKIDSMGKAAVEHFGAFQHPEWDSDAFHALLLYLTVQKLRTPKGLDYLAAFAQTNQQDRVLLTLRDLQNVYCAIWTECVWCILDASQSPTKLLLSDHPVTVYNSACFPGSEWCRGFNDPDIRRMGTHTLFPLSYDKLLVLTNLAWLRDPYGDPMKERPNSDFFRDTIFNFTQIQTGRMLSEEEVWEINYIIKQRARRYIAAAHKESLYPEKHMPRWRWDRLGGGYLLMPDPRSVDFTTEVVIGYKDKTAESFDEYGRRPGQRDFRDKARRGREHDTHLAFRGEYARVFGPRRRGQGWEHGRERLEDSEDSPDYHKYHLSLEGKFKPPGARRRGFK